MFSERGVGPLRGLSALIVDDVASIFSEHSLLTSLVDLVVLVYNQLENPGKMSAWLPDWGLLDCFLDTRVPVSAATRIHV